jgi:hypothetical protein
MGELEGTVLGVLGGELGSKLLGVGSKLLGEL